jgi:uncharacterized protein DUF1573
MAAQEAQTVEDRPAKRRDELQRWMIALAATFCVVAVALNLWAWFGPGSWGPRLQCDAPHFDFGERDVNDSIDHEFALTNTGYQDLLIRDISADCSCVTAKVTSVTVPPRKSLIVPVHISLKNEQNGDLRRRLLVQSNDSVNPQLVLTLSGRVHRSRPAAK